MGNSYKWEAKKISDLYTDVNIAEQASKATKRNVNEQPDFVTYKEPKSLYHSEHSPFGYMPNGKDKKSSNPLKRWQNKVGRVWNLYTETGNPLGLWKPVVAGIVANGLKTIETLPEERQGVFEDLFGGLVTITIANLEQYAHNMPYKISPMIRRHLSAAEGASNLKYLYTYDKPGDPREYALYLSGGEIPDNNVLLQNKAYIDNQPPPPPNPKSPYADDTLDLKGKIKGLFDRQDGPPVLNAATLFDYADYFAEEPDKAERWAVKDDSWLAQQYGDRQFAMEAALPVSLSDVKIYERPVKTSGFFYNLGKLLGDESPRSGRMWLEWVFKKPATYLFGDFFAEPLEVVAEKILPPEAMRYMVYEKSKGIAGSWRGMSNPRPSYLWFG